MKPHDARLIAALTMLRDHLAPLIDEFTFGELAPDDRRQLARALRLVANDLDPAPVAPGGRAAAARRDLA